MNRTRVWMASMVVLALSLSTAPAQWRWEPGRGWQPARRPSPYREPSPPPFLPRYHEEVREAPLGTPTGAYYAAYLLYQADQFLPAARMFARLAEEQKDNPLLAARALFMQGECLYQAGLYHRAYKAFDRMLTNYPGARNYRLAMRRVLEIAQMFMRGRRRRLLGLPLLPGPRAAVEILERLHQHDPTGPLADDALALLADYHFRKGNYEEADFQYRRLLREHPQSPYAAQAEFRLALSRFFRQHGAEYDMGLLRRARAGFQRFLRRHPDAPEAPRAEMYLKRVEERLAEGWLYRGEFYRRRGQPGAALVYYRRILEEFPTTTAAAEAEARLRKLAPRREGETGE